MDSDMFAAGKLALILIVCCSMVACGGEEDGPPPPLAFSVSATTDLIDEGDTIRLSYSFKKGLSTDVIMSVDKGEVDPLSQTITWKAYLVEKDTLESIVITASDGLETYTQTFDFIIVDASYVFYFDDPDTPKQHFWDDRNYASPRVNQAYIDGLVRRDTPINLGISEKGMVAHPDLSDFEGYYPSNIVSHYHGTMVGSVLAAKQNNGQGIAGMVGNVNLYRVYVILYGWSEYAINNNIPVINASHGEVNCIKNPNLQLEIDSYIEWGGLLTVSSGNDAGITEQSCDKIILVASVDKEGTPSHFSDKGSNVTLSAIGEDLYLATVGKDYTRTNGTSFSAPQVAAALALAKQKHPQLNYELAALALSQTAKPFSGDIESEGFGAGILDAYAFLDWLESYYGD